MVHEALGAGQHAVVVGHHRDRPAVDRRGAHDQAVRRGARDEVVERAAAALRGDRQRAVLYEAAGIDEVGDVLAGCPPSGGVAPLGDFGPGLVEPDPVPLPHLRQIRPDVIHGYIVGLRRLGDIALGLGQQDQHRPGLYGGTHRHRHLVHQAGGLGPHLVLHLHRLDDEQLVARGDRVSWPDRDRYHRAGQRRAHRGAAGRHVHGGEDGPGIPGISVLAIGGRGDERDRARGGELGGVRVDPSGLERAEPGHPQQGLQQGHVGGHSGDVELGQRPHRPARRLLERAAVGDHLGQ